MGRIYTRVSRVATWAGWCSPCEREDRPLVLTRSGPGGLVSWLSGLGDDDRLLLLTCRVCGQWQHVPAREEDDPEVVLEHDVQGEVLELITHARSAPAVPVVPLPRVAPAPEPVAAPAAEVAEVTEVAEVVELPTAPPVEAPAAVVPAPRPAVPRIVTVPDAQTLPAFSPEAVEAAARVLAAARAQTQRTVAPRPAPLDRSRRTSGGPTPRRTERAATVRVTRTAMAELPRVVGLPAGTRSVVLAAAS